MCRPFTHTVIARRAASLLPSLLAAFCVLVPKEGDGHLFSTYCVPAALHTLSPSLVTSPVHSLCWSLPFLSVFFLPGKELTLNKHLLYAQQFPPMTLLGLSLLGLSLLPSFCCGGLVPFLLTCSLGPEDRNGHLGHLLCAGLWVRTASPPHSWSPSPSPCASAASPLPSRSPCSPTGRGRGTN